MFLFGPTTVLHLNHQVCTKSRRSLQLTHKILTWCQPQLALLRAAHISGACNQSGKGRCTFQGLITSRGMETSSRGSTGDLALVLEGQRWIFLLQRRPSFGSNGSQRQKCPVPWARMHCLTNSRAAYFMCFLQSLCYGRLYIGPLCASTECYLWHHDGQPDHGFLCYWDFWQAICGSLPSGRTSSPSWSPASGTQIQLVCSFGCRRWDKSLFGALWPCSYSHYLQR